MVELCVIINNFVIWVSYIAFVVLRVVPDIIGSDFRIESDNDLNESERMKFTVLKSIC